MGSEVIYSSFPDLTPSERNKVVGGVHTSDYVYCRHCIDALGLEWADMKYLTVNRAKVYIYNCYRCGLRITHKTRTRT